MRPGARGLVRLGEGAEGGSAAREAKALERLSRAWPLVVGPALAPLTRPLHLRHRTLVLGCWRTDLIPGLRAGAEGAWPDVRDRLARMLNLKVERMEVVPCDPPPPSVPAVRREGDPLKLVLQRLRALRSGGWTPTRR